MPASQPHQQAELRHVCVIQRKPRSGSGLNQLMEAVYQYAAGQGHHIALHRVSGPALLGCMKGMRHEQLARTAGTAPGERRPLQSPDLHRPAPAQHCHADHRQLQPQALAPPHVPEQPPPSSSPPPVPPPASAAQTQQPSVQQAASLKPPAPPTLQAREAVPVAAPQAVRKSKRQQKRARAQLQGSRAMAASRSSRPASAGVGAGAAPDPAAAAAASRGAQQRTPASAEVLRQQLEVAFNPARERWCTWSMRVTTDDELVFAEGD